MVTRPAVTSAPITPEEVIVRVMFAAWRLEDLKVHIDGGVIGRRIGEKLQLIQEFFFHLIGAREVLALLINEKRNLGLDPEKVSIGKVAKLLSSDDPIYSMVRELTVDPRREPFPSDPYTDSAYIYRAILYRNQVAHRHRTPLYHELQFPQGGKKLFLYLDPRNPEAGHSKAEALSELETIRDHLIERYKKICEAL
jgi:hypothetical protein